jgi:Na+/proline symporter/nitrogen-specific signal transduction histidine kinase
MLARWLVLLSSFAYLGLLFAVARFAERRGEQGRSIIASPYVYSLSLAVYCTAWTFYGSVGRAATTGLGFLPTYLGATLMAATWWTVLRKILRISKRHRITSIADFIGSRYGKSTLLASLVTVIAVVGIMPYISLQLKAVSTSYTVLLAPPGAATPHAAADAGAILLDKVFWVALLMAAFSILFGTRHIDATEHHEGMVAAIAFESFVKLVAFLSGGVFIVWGVYGGLGELFARASAALPDYAALISLEGIAPGTWIAHTLLASFAILLLPRQFQVAVVENVDERHVQKAVWLLPLYLLAINLFVIPIALAGRLHFPAGAVDPDVYVLALPLVEGWPWLALFVFIGGLSAATGMIIVETIALSTMVSNDLVMPALLRLPWLRLDERADLSGLVLAIRRVTIVGVLLLGYAYFRGIGDVYALVSIGMISFAAAAQFAPAILGGIYWKGGTRAGALVGLSAGFVVWLYTLLLPSFARSGWLPAGFVEAGPAGIEWLRPYALFGLAGLEEVTHALFWSLLANLAGYVGVSLFVRPSVLEHAQASLFVDAWEHAAEGGGSRFWRGSASLPELRSLLRRFVGHDRADAALEEYARARGLRSARELTADAELVGHAEALLAGAIGAASARVMVASVAREEPLGIDEVMRILDETRHAIAHSQALEAKSRELERATAELRAANERLQQLDRLKDDFISTVTHELRTPLTSIRSFSEILFDNPDLEEPERARFLQIIIRENERLTRLINQVLDLEKLESGVVEWHIEPVDAAAVVREAIAASSRLFEDAGVRLEAHVPEALPPVRADRDRAMQVLLNLLSNAARFTPAGTGRVEVRAAREDGSVRIDVRDNGPGIARADRARIFEKFAQVGGAEAGWPGGTGLGLPISRQIVEHLGGRIWVESEPGRGAQFSFTLPLAHAGAEPRILNPQP